MTRMRVAVPLKWLVAPLIWIRWRIWNVQILLFKEWNNDWMKAKFEMWIGQKDL